MTTLRKALYANAMFTALTSLVALVWAGPIAKAFRVEQWVLVAAGAVLLGWAALVTWFARRDPTRRAEAWLVIAGDELWIIGVIVLLAAFPDALSNTGKLWLATLTLVVAILASFQLLGLRRIPREESRNS